MSEALALRDELEVTSMQALERAKQDALIALQEAREPREVKDIYDRGRAALAWAQARRSSEAADIAREVQVRAERRLGEMRLSLPHEFSTGKQRDEPTAVQSFDREMGVSKRHAQDWQRLALSKPEDFEQALTAMRSRGKELTRHGLLYFLGNYGTERVEEGVLRLTDGRFRIYGAANGKKFTRTLGAGVTIEQARERRTLALKGRPYDLLRGALEEAKWNAALLAGELGGEEARKMENVGAVVARLLRALPSAKKAA